MERVKERNRIYRKADRDFIRKLKEQPCVDCKRTFPYYVMDFDHVHGKKEFNVGTGLGRRTRKILLTEISKCEIVCANCHRERTHKARQANSVEATR